jgi:hypothetical protein
MSAILPTPGVRRQQGPGIRGFWLELSSVLCNLQLTLIHGWLADAPGLKLALACSAERPLLMEHGMRTTERLLLGLCFGGSVIAGAAHIPQWLLVTPLCFAGLTLAEDRAVRHRIGFRTWPSEAYARFLFNTNLYRTLRNSLASSALFLAAAAATSLIRS